MAAGHRCGGRGEGDMMMLPLPLVGNEGRLKILCLGAHADEVVIGAGGTILRKLGNRLR